MKNHLRTLAQKLSGWGAAFCTVAVASILAPSALAKPFTLPVMPDTQIAVNSRPELLFSQVNWLAQHKKALRMPIVLHVGDIVDYNNFDHWERASRAFRVLDEARLPYALAVGNHDTAAVGQFSGSAAPGNVNANLRSTRKFNAYFPVSRLSAQRGRYIPGHSDNAYYTFRAGGLKWLVVTLEFCARPGPVDWANQILASHPRHNVIILTHFHLTSKGEINQTNAGYGDLTCQAIYDRLIK
ncbi:MAG: hypothetical protein JWN98_659 [Abditibacteriota bacterium]|nr:hypothetical protein [Abditibacteriota bacterium]